MELHGKVAIVTGGCRGIGEGISVSLAKNGADVVIGDLSPIKSVMEKVRGLGRKGLLVKVDVTKAGEVKEMVDKTLNSFGRIDILVNNAGVVSYADFLEISEEEWDRVINVNLKGTFLCCKAVVPAMVRQREGRIINISSTAGKEAPPGLAHYSASKFGVIGLTQAIAKELGQYNITVNAVCPGMVFTDMWRYLSKAIGEKERKSAETAWMDRLKARIPLGRPQTPEDIGNMVVYLASENGRNITGQAINVSGGYVTH